MGDGADNRLARVEEHLYGVPGDQQRPGLLNLVLANQKQTRENSAAIRELSVILKGLNGDGKGLLDRVRENTRFRRLVERFGLWVGGAITLAAVAQVVQFVVWAIREMGSP